MNTSASRIQQLIQSNAAYYTPVLSAARHQSRTLCRTFRDQAGWVSGWAHDFACPDCASHLVFEETMPYNPPNTFRCPHCGRTVSGQKLDEAWVYYYRQYAAGHLEAVAVCALLGDEEARAFLERYFDFYAASYAGFEIHGEGAGKIMPQVLDEAVWCVQTTRALYPCRHLFSEEKRQHWHQNLFVPLIELINAPEKQTSVHNHVLWHKCAAGCAALCFDDSALLDEVLNGHLGVRDLARRGFTADGFWHEGSPLYHYYALEALTGFVQLFAHVHPDDPLVGLLERTHLAPLALDQWNLPSVNDGWFPLSLDRFADQFHRAAAASGSEALWRQVERIRQHNPEAVSTPCSLLIDPAPEAITLWKSTNLAVVRYPVHAILKSGVLTRSHMHKDYLSVILPPFSRDLGTPGYGHALYRSWYQLAASHNTVTVDLDQPRPVIPSHLEETENGVRAVIDSGWEGITSASRTLTPEGDHLHDRTEIVCDGVHTIDWLFHAEGDVQFSAPLGEEAFPGDRCGYEHLTDVRKIDCEDLTVTFTLDGQQLTLQANTRDLQVFAAKSPSNPSDELRTVIILRTASDRAVFDVRYTQTSL